MDLDMETILKMDPEISNSKIHKRAKMVVGIEWVLGICGTVLILLALMFYLSGANEEVAPLLTYRPYIVKGGQQTVDKSPEAIKRAIIYVAVLSASVLVSSAIPISLSILLAMGITHRNIVKCKLWMALHVLVFFGCLGIFIAEIVRGRRFHLAIYISVGFFVALRLFVMKLVVDYIVTIKEEDIQIFRALHLPRFRTIGIQKV